MPSVYHILTLPRFREFLSTGWRLSPADADHAFLWFSPRPPEGLEMDEVVLVLDPATFASQLIKRGTRGWRTGVPHTTIKLGPEHVERLLVADEHLVPGIQALVPNLRVIPLEQEARVALHDYAHDPAAMFDLENADPGDRLCPGGRPNCIDGLHSHPQGENGPARAHPAIVKGKQGAIGAPNFFRKEPHAPNSKSIAKTDTTGYHGQHVPKGAVYKGTPESVAEAAFDSTIKNTDLVRTAAGLAAAAKQRPLNPTTIRRFVERLVYALEVSVMAVLDRADAMRFSSLVRAAVASIEDAATEAEADDPAHRVKAESAGDREQLQKPLAQLRALVVDSTSELAKRDGQSHGRGGGLRSPRDQRPHHRPRPVARDDGTGE